MANDGFIKVRKGIKEHIQEGRITPFDFAIYMFLHLYANYETGIYVGNAFGIATTFNEDPHHVGDALRRLRKNGYINYLHQKGFKGFYRIFIHKYEPTCGLHEGKRLNAFAENGLAAPMYEAKTCELHEGYMKATCGLHEGSMKATQYKKEDCIDGLDVKMTTTVAAVATEAHSPLKEASFNSVGFQSADSYVPKKKPQIPQPKPLVNPQGFSVVMDVVGSVNAALEAVGGKVTKPSKGVSNGSYPAWFKNALKWVADNNTDVADLTSKLCDEIAQNTFFTEAFNGWLPDVPWLFTEKEGELGIDKVLNGKYNHKRLDVVKAKQEAEDKKKHVASKPVLAENLTSAAKIAELQQLGVECI